MFAPIATTACAASGLDCVEFALQKGKCLCKWPLREQILQNDQLKLAKDVIDLEFTPPNDVQSP